MIAPGQVKDATPENQQLGKIPSKAKERLPGQIQLSTIRFWGARLVPSRFLANCDFFPRIPQYKSMREQYPMVAPGLALAVRRHSSRLEGETPRCCDRRNCSL